MNGSCSALALSFSRYELRMSSRNYGVSSASSSKVFRRLGVISLREKFRTG